MADTGRPDFGWARLGDIAPHGLYDMLRLRVDVFVVEQACPYAELDGRDGDATHLRCFVDGSLAGTLRVFAPGPDGVAIIGRVAVARAFRGRQLGRAMMQEALSWCRAAYGDVPLALAAQAHLQDFYAGFGFQPVSGSYLEDGIAHVDMRREQENLPARP